MASDLALQLRHAEFKCSNGWFSSLQERNNLSFVTVCGESGSANKRVIDAWKEHTLAPLLSEYGTDDVYNLDKAVLFYKMLQTFAVKDTAVKGQKQAHGVIPHLKVVRMVFLPPNTTSFSQPMDQGVIKQTRKIYRHHLLERMLLCFDNGKEYSIDLLGATCVIVYAWRDDSFCGVTACLASVLPMDRDMFDRVPVTLLFRSSSGV
ncbi:tigger transposable element-derived protein 4-like [Dermacentor andersoni]|uniref:tigger transposable element-derived protein 4-like n=1 Tax=Dermacentor andersoni TaxID=34620 RepID=UPI003B3A8C35